jgi:hypothetical protein
MLIPKFTIRTILIITAAVAVLAWVISQGTAGAKWAQSLAWVAAFVVLLFGVYACCFTLMLLVSKLLQARGIQSQTTVPFATPHASELQPPAE